jgi:transcription-repair coupling factor (superfamily II helicase)
MAPMVLRKIQELPDLVPRLHRADGFAGVLSALQRGDHATIGGAWGSSCALTAAALAAEVPKTLLVVLPRISDVDDFAGDVAGFLKPAPLIFPAWESLPQEYNVADAVFGGRRRVLSALGEKTPPRVVVTSIAALLQPVPSQQDRQRATRILRVGDEIEPESLLRWLIDRGFDRVPVIEMPGEFSMHGGIVDLFPPDAGDPLRLEFFGDEIESIRRFDVETQRKLEDLEHVSLMLVKPVERVQTDPGGDGSSVPSFSGDSFLDDLPDGSWVALTALQDLIDEGKQYLSRLDEPRGLYSVDATMARCTAYPMVTIAALAIEDSETVCHLSIESIERFTGPQTEAIQELASVVSHDEQVLISCHNEGERERLSELIAEAQVPMGVELCLGNVTRGFRMVHERIVVLSDHELFGRANLRRALRRKKKLQTRAIDSFLDLKEGDLVVHLTHGIGRYRGMKLLEDDEQFEEFLVLEFRGGVRIYVPISLIHLVQKYVGAAKSAPRLSNPESSSWSKKKEKVAQAVIDMASEMIRLQAAREAKPGIAFPPDSHWQQEFEASFPYTETADQIESIIDVKEDMQKLRPMDRLLCGDVGYGKTEVAMRAAFKAIEAGKQVAVLVPTTVLAEQHYRTFRERMAEYPINIEVLSRFRTKGQQRKILEALEKGTVDLVVGTHRLVQKDVTLKDLGLLIIDEEQRFGVEAKEMLKRLRMEVDVLTMSATPIPRTLHMSILGIRDISNLQTPPQDRQAIETRICRFDKELIRNAIIRELNRNGQIYFVHNLVYNIQSVADTIQAIVPEARIGIGHGQMREHELEDAMFNFVSGQTDVLVCTTIIESGLDIPNANTIFIHQADRYGLADLHQLRGRVGRSAHRAYCYLMLEAGRSLTSIAARRLKAIEEFSELGAGFKIAIRDLEIRGAGNILGSEQSGHISSVGYELYCQLLENTVRRLKNEPIREQFHVACDLPISAFLPDAYVPPGRQKIEIYRQFSSIASLGELREFANELRDRFGPIAEEASRLIELKELQLAAQSWEIDDIRLEGKFAVFDYRNPKRIQDLAKQRGRQLRVVDSRTAYWLLPKAELAGDELLEHLKSVLQPN